MASEITDSFRTRARVLLREALSDPQARFREGQLQAIEALVLRRERLLVVQRTGWGKSMVYFIATRLLRDAGAGPTLLISPLISLMRNQLVAAQRIGLQAATVHSQNHDDWDRIATRLRSGAVDLLLVSPERLANATFRNEWLRPLLDNLGLFVVDEAHCISDWGHDFRPDYRRIVRLIRQLSPETAVLATTATANQRVIDDIRSQIDNLQPPIRGPLARQSLRLQLLNLPSQAERFAWLAEHLPHLPGSGIVYTMTVNDAKRISEWLESHGVDAPAYYGARDGEVREQLEQRLLDNDVKTLIATTALGMGFDKPDLGFVIHFQRPASAVHYYQQVGRAGRALDTAFGVLMCGEEDDRIAEYFMQTAFPPQQHVDRVLEELGKAATGASLPTLQKKLNLRYSRLEHVLNYLATEETPPVEKRGHIWFRTGAPYEADMTHAARITRLRQAEQRQMQWLMRGERCLMQLLREELSDPTAEPCGQCCVCLQRPLLPETVLPDLVVKAQRFLRRSEEPILPRKRWPKGALKKLGFEGTIAEDLRAEEGRVLARWGDAGWGDLIRSGKQKDGRFADVLAQAMTEMIQRRWRPEPSPTWVTWVPSVRHPDLVPDFARRLAARLRLPCVSSLEKTRDNLPQKTRENSFQQAKNLDAAFQVIAKKLPDGPVLLVDDMVDSRWTMTVLAALLRQAGVPAVYPVALARSTAM